MGDHMGQSRGGQAAEDDDGAPQIEARTDAAGQKAGPDQEDEDADQDRKPLA
ncbi:hypothetical protein D3C73_1512310 [compost metagenome]